DHSCARLRRNAKPSLTSSFYTGFSSQPRYPVSSPLESLRPKFPPGLERSIGLPAATMHCTDLAQHHTILLRTLGLRPIPPVVVPVATNLEHRTQIGRAHV